MKKPALLLLSLACPLLFATSAAAALGSSSKTAAAGRTQQAGNFDKAVPFGGARSAYKDARRAPEVRPPSSTLCALREQTQGIGTTRQDASGKIQVFNDPRNGKGASGDIYGDCNRSLAGRVVPRVAVKPTSAYNASTNTLKAASDGYVNRAATSSMMPKKAPSMYDPATGTLRATKRPNAYQIYQE
ncbi:hypothetical protein [Zoogloea sp.]|uniref:hypothetical protein n=1 Tax=Zoogloea sp. TaxID=49181 RepID=UPI0035B141B7